MHKKRLNCLRSVAAAFAVCALLAGTAGCRGPAYLATNLLPVAKIKKVYQPTDQKTLIFIDDPRNAVPSIQMLGLIAEKAAIDLKEQNVITDFVSTAALNELSFNEPDFKSWPVDRVGKELGARQVIYLAVDSFEPGGRGNETYRPIASGRVRVIDVNSGKRMFPAIGEHGVSRMLYFKQVPAEGASKGRQDAITRLLAEELGEALAKLFYDHKPRAVGSGFND